MKQIPLTQGKYAIVDDEDFSWLSQWKWYAQKSLASWYAIRYAIYEKVTIPMHRQILGLKSGDGIESDHRNHNGLDNRRINLRACSCAQNQYNQIPQRNCTSKYKGIYWKKANKKWRVQIKLNQRNCHIGYYKKEIEAAKAYDAKAKELFGEFANLNFI